MLRFRRVPSLVTAPRMLLATRPRSSPQRGIPARGCGFACLEFPRRSGRLARRSVVVVRWRDARGAAEAATAPRRSARGALRGRACVRRSRPSADGKERLERRTAREDRARGAQRGGHGRAGELQDPCGHVRGARDRGRGDSRRVLTEGADDTLLRSTVGSGWGEVRDGVSDDEQVSQESQSRDAGRDDGDSRARAARSPRPSANRHRQHDFVTHLATRSEARRRRAMSSARNRTTSFGRVHGASPDSGPSRNPGWSGR